MAAAASSAAPAADLHATSAKACHSNGRYCIGNSAPRIHPLSSSSGSAQLRDPKNTQLRTSIFDSVDPQVRLDGRFSFIKQRPHHHHRHAIRMSAVTSSSSAATLPPARITGSAAVQPLKERTDQQEEVEQDQKGRRRRVADDDSDDRDGAYEAYWDYQALFVSQRKEVAEAIELEVVEGTVPVDLRGSYFLTGPGVFSDDFGSSIHPLDGHGYLRRFHFPGSSTAPAALYSARYINTKARLEEYDHETDSWNFKYRGPFSMLRPGERIGNVKVMKNTANTSVYKWAGHLMCLWEGGEPYELDPNSLDTIGLLSMTSSKSSQYSTIDLKPSKIPKVHSMPFPLQINQAKDFIMQAIKANMVGIASKLVWPILSGVFSMPKERMLSHCRIDVKRQRLVAITCYAEDMILPTSTFTIYEFDSSMKLLQKKRFSMQEQLMIHDWGLTDNYYVLIANRVKLDYTGSLGAFAGLTPMISALTLDQSLPYAPMYLLPRFPSEDESQRDWRAPVKLPEPLWLLHVANAYEEKTKEGLTKVVMYASACTYEWFSLKHIFGYDWQQRRLNPNLMNDQTNSYTKSGELGAPHLVKISTRFNPLKNEDYLATIHRPQGWKKGCDFPSINIRVSGIKNQYTFVSGSSRSRKAFQNFPFDTIVKIRNSDEKADTWWAGRRSFVGEPIFVPRYKAMQEANQPGFHEDDGYLLCVQYAVAEQTCYLVILDAQKISQKDALVAKLRIPKKFSFPLGFHGFWEESQ